MWLLAVVGVSAFAVTFERWWNLRKRTDCDAAALFGRVRALIEDKKIEEAYAICAAGGKRALPRIMASGIKKSQTEPSLVSGAMQEESIHMSSMLETRMNYLVMFSNTATLFGLLGTVYGLIMSFAAVSKPGVDAVAKSALLASGISTAMNATLVGLSISVLCVMAYAALKAKMDSILGEIDRYAIATLNLLNPPTGVQHALQSAAGKRGGGDDDETADADVTPMLNLMVILIPVLLTSSEFIKLGTIDIKLPEASGGGGGGGGAAEEQQKELKLDLGVIITSKGFNLIHVFKTDAVPASAQALAERPADIPKINGNYDFETLNKELSRVKQRVLYEIVKAYVPGTAANTPLEALHNTFLSKNLSGATLYADHENVKIVGEEKIQYATVIAVMDAARGFRISGVGGVTMFPNVSIAGGIVQ